MGGRFGTEGGVIAEKNCSGQPLPATREGLFTTKSQRPGWQVSTSQTVSYEVRVTQRLLDPGNDALIGAGVSGPSAATRRLVVVDRQVFRLHAGALENYFAARRVEYALCVIDAHEANKSLDTALQVVRAMDAFGIARRREPVIAIGGGVLTDIVGLATSLYRRATPYVKVPTTLIGMVDAGIGVKTGVNFDHHKNRLGSYHPASVTLVDPSFLATLTEKHVRNGLAEILKIGLVKDAALFDLLARHGRQLIRDRLGTSGGDRSGEVASEVMRRAIHGMLEELQPNLWEQELKRLVDYGHSFSPTIEMQALPELLHGEAVCVDMALTTVLAQYRGMVSPTEARHIWQVMGDLGLPRWHPVCTPELLLHALEDTVRHRDGRQLLPLPVGVGSARFVDDVTPAELTHACADMERLTWEFDGPRRYETTRT
ncbi:sedoheptulose 7-phosphate cyclase [Micromonospora sp. NPDC048898]|uniref:sedoheptulose 7-phosphate cyclase n=1 Tax=Micromonospora sp. NPDC048898 TaxID=3364260 RepID=UPI0037168611